MNKSIKELSEAVKTLQQIILTKANLPEVSFKCLLVFVNDMLNTYYI